MNAEAEEIFDKGPWTVCDTRHPEVYVESDDFNHDVSLRVLGDFADFSQRKAYAEYLAAALTRGCAIQHALQQFPDEMALAFALVKVARGPHGALLLAAAEELSRMRVALEATTAALEKTQAEQRLVSHTRQANEPSAFAQALQSALRQAK